MGWERILGSITETGFALGVSERETKEAAMVIVDGENDDVR